MGSVYRPTYTKPLPHGAEIVMRAGKPVARWVDAAGKKRHAPATGPGAKRPGIVVEASTFVAKFRDADGRERRVPTGCRTKDGARACLAELEAKVEKVRAGILTKAEAEVSEHAETPVPEAIDAYLRSLALKRGRGAKKAVSPTHVSNVGRALRLAVEECGFVRLRDLSREPVEAWVARLLSLPDDNVSDDVGEIVALRRPSARTINARLAALTAWGNWLVETSRLATNPFPRLRKLDEADDVRRQRRALTGDELRRLLIAARYRPLAEHGRETIKVIDPALPAKSRATWEKLDLDVAKIVAAAARGRERVRPEVADELELVGRERALLYTVLVTTGLRRGELAALRVGDLKLEGPSPVIELRGADAKNGQRATLPVRADVAAELRAWVADLEKRAVGNLRPDSPVFNVPSGLIRILDRDLAVAGIAKVDDRGRTVDVHAFRHTFATHLVAAGVAPRTAQAALRHSSLELTTQLYTDPRLLEVAGALEALPALPKTDAGEAIAPVVPANSLVPVLVLDRVKQGHLGAFPVPEEGDSGRGTDRGKSRDPREKSEKPKSGRRDSNPRHPAWEASALPTELRPRTKES